MKTMNQRMGWMGCVTVMCGGLMLAGGCSNGPKGLETSQDAYRSGNYERAYLEARTVADTPGTKASDRDTAEYMAGMAAYRNRDLMVAQQYLQAATESHDPHLAADAKASLGLVYADRGLYDLSARSLLEAAEAMAGQDKANALFYAGVAQQKGGRWPEARTNLSMAISNSHEPAFRKRVADQLRITGYTLQTGVFDVESHARNAAQSLAHTAKELKMSPPRVVPAIDPVTHRERYLVWVGQFSSWPTAQMGRDELGVTSAAVTPLAEAAR